MSRWTHINASFRLDSIKKILDEEIECVFGKAITFKDMYDYEADGTSKVLPMGSEGSLEMSIWHNPDRSFLSSTTVSVFGDLRDFGDEQDIEGLKLWFNDCCEQFRVRQAFMQIEDEWSDKPIILLHNIMED